MLWLAAQTYLLCLVSFIAGAVLTVLVLRKRVPAPAAAEPESTVDERADERVDDTADDMVDDKETERVKEPSA